MATVNVTGMADVLDEMTRLGETSGETAQRMIFAGAEVVKQSWKRVAEERGHVKHGDMRDSVDYPRTPTRIGDALSLDIYPQGKDRRGVRNAEKAFILHYGSSRITGDHWVDEAEKEADEPSLAAMQDIWDEHIKG